MHADEDPYRTLGIEPDATIEEIKRAYHEAAIRWHPDVSKADPAESQRQFRLATDAYKHVLREALLAAREARKESQVRADSSEPARCDPHAERRYYTPPPPHQGSPESLRPSRRSSESDTAGCIVLFGASLIIIPAAIFLLGLVFTAVGVEQDLALYEILALLCGCFFLIYGLLALAWRAIDRIGMRSERLRNPDYGGDEREKEDKGRAEEAYPSS